MVQKVLSMIFFHFKKCFWLSVGKSSYLFFEVQFRSLKFSNFSPETAGLAKVLAWNPNTQWKRYFVTHSDCWVKMEDEVYKPEVLRNIWTLIGYMIENFRNITTDVSRYVLRKIGDQTNSCHSVWYSKSWSVSHGFFGSLCCSPKFKIMT